MTCAMGQARVQEPGPCPEWPSALDSQQWPRGSWEVPPPSFSRAHVRLRLCSCKGTVVVGPLGQGGPCCPPRGPSLCLVSCTAQVPERTEAAAAHKRASERDPQAGTGTMLWAAAGLHWASKPGARGRGIWEHAAAASSLFPGELRVPWLLSAQPWSVGMHVNTCEHVCRV